LREIKAVNQVAAHALYRKKSTLLDVTDVVTWPYANICNNLPEYENAKYKLHLEDFKKQFLLIRRLRCYACSGWGHTKIHKHGPKKLLCPVSEYVDIAYL